MKALATRTEKEGLEGGVGLTRVRNERVNLAHYIRHSLLGSDPWGDFFFSKGIDQKLHADA